MHLVRTWADVGLRSYDSKHTKKNRERPAMVSITACRSPG
jgi:hypothetical protein